MNTGQIISGAGHLGLIAWALFGNLLASEPIPFEVTEVTAISEEQFAAVMAAQRPPDAAAEIATPQAPDVPQEAPALSSQVDTTPEQPAPDAAQSANPDAAPKLTQTAPPVEAEVSDEPPVLEPPQEDIAALVPETALRPKPRPVERVAPEQVAPPEPDTAVDDVQREEVRPDESAETPAEESEATAPEEAATEIVTEAEQAAPSKSVRPKARPARAPAPEPKPEQTQTAQTPPEPTEVPPEPSGVDAALAAALGGATEAPAETPKPTSSPISSGPPLSAGETDALRVAVQQCWNVGSLSSEALNTTVVVGVQMTEDARPVSGSIRLISATGGSADAAKQAYETARRAIIRCGARGYNLPADKYGAWRDIEMTFNPEKMRIK